MITSRKLTNNPDITSVSVFYSSYECVPSTPNTQPTPFLQQLVCFLFCLFIQIWIHSLLVLPLVLTIVKTLSLKCFEFTRDGLKTKFTTNDFNLWNSDVILWFFLVTLNGQPRHTLEVPLFSLTNCHYKYFIPFCLYCPYAYSLIHFD